MIGRAHVGVVAAATAPVRVADVGGWTDTWFGSPGQVCHLAVGPGVQVEATVVESLPPTEAGGSVRVQAPEVGVALVVRGSGGGWGTEPDPAERDDPLLRHAVAAAMEGVVVERDVQVEVAIRSAVPPGASLGTSAAVLVALLGALDGVISAIRGAAPLAAEDLAVRAHQVETVLAGREAGVQDQWAAAMGGAGLLAIGPYPDVRHRRLGLPAGAEEELGRRLVTVIFGPHDSSAVHRQVIDALISCSGVEHHDARSALRKLSTLAVRAAEALEAGDLDGWGEVLLRSVDAQAQLHPGLVGAPHAAAIGAARQVGAVGWKVNGAGGDGGSLTVLLSSSDPDVQREAFAAALAEGPGGAIAGLVPAAGLRVAVSSG